MTESLAQNLVEFFGDKIPGELTIFIISLLPILELRGGIIAAALLNIPIWKAFIICYVGNLLPIPFILLFIKKIFEWLRRFRFFARFIEKMEAKSERNRDKILRYKQWGLLLFVAIPLPGTGGWTGALMASLLEIDIKKSMPIIAIGVLIAGVIMTILSYGIKAIFA
ncbi:MAG: small multi-drug export protein [Clostridia bacterium]|nr:small multi-drug export protein [Clostridia bacterium]